MDNDKVIDLLNTMKGHADNVYNRESHRNLCLALSTIIDLKKIPLYRALGCTVDETGLVLSVPSFEEYCK